MKAFSGCGQGIKPQRGLAWLTMQGQFWFDKPPLYFLVTAHDQIVQATFLCRQTMARDTWG